MHEICQDKKVQDWEDFGPNFCCKESFKHNSMLRLPETVRVKPLGDKLSNIRLTTSKYGLKALSVVFLARIKKRVTLNSAQSAEFRAGAPKIGDSTQSAQFMKFAKK